jgi:hypothetical protein
MPDLRGEVSEPVVSFFLEIIKGQSQATVDMAGLITDLNSSEFFGLS